MPGPRRSIVIGGTGGLGAAVVDALVARGDRVLATGRDTSRLEALAGRGVATHRLDLRSPRCGEELAYVAGKSLGRAIDGLVVAAGGLGPIGPTRSIDADDMAETLNEHLIGALRIVQACATFLDRGRDPSVALFSGGGATGPFPRYTAYALAKVATVRLVENLAAEEPGWRVNAVAPGFVATGIHRATLALPADVVGPYREETRRRLRDAAPPEEAAALIAFLLSDASAGITGRLISAVWDPWREEAGRRVLRGPSDFGRLRRVDEQRYYERR